MWMKKKESTFRLNEFNIDSEQYREGKVKIYLYKKLKFTET